MMYRCCSRCRFKGENVSVEYICQIALVPESWDGLTIRDCKLLKSLPASRNGEALSVPLMRFLFAFHDYDLRSR